MGIFQYRLFTLTSGLVLVVLIFMYIRLESELKQMRDDRIKVGILINRFSSSQANGEKQIENVLDEFDENSYNAGSAADKSVDETVIIYNRVPKTGSTTLMGILYDLCKTNKFNVIHLNISRNSHVLSISDQARFIHNITKWKERLPAVYHGHVGFINFRKFGINNHPIYINVVREPLERLISYYYFLRNGDDFRPYLVRKRQKDRETSFDDCVERNGRDCDPRNMWLEIPFFCGQAAECLEPGSSWALEMAKQNLITNYLVVGVTEQMRDMLAVLEVSLPRFFAGSTALYDNGSKSHLRKTSNKLKPRSETVASIRKSEIWKMEHEFYEFARDQFNFMKEHTFSEYQDSLKVRGKMFFYEKIRPR